MNYGAGSIIYSNYLISIIKVVSVSVIVSIVVLGSGGKRSAVSFLGTS